MKNVIVVIIGSLLIASGNTNTPALLDVPNGTNEVVLLPDSAFNTPGYELAIYNLLNYTMLSIEDVEYLYSNYTVMELSVIPYISLPSGLYIGDYETFIQLILDKLPYTSIDDINPVDYKSIVYNYLNNTSQLEYNALIVDVLKVELIQLILDKLPYDSIEDINPLNYDNIIYSYLSDVSQLDYSSLLLSILNINESPGASSMSYMPLLSHYLSVSLLPVNLNKLSQLEYKEDYREWVAVTSKPYNDLSAHWERLNGIALHYVGPHQIRFVPHPFTKLGKRRVDILRRWESPVITSEDERVLREYYKDLSVALNRRNNLGKKFLQKRKRYD